MKKPYKTCPDCGANLAPEEVCDCSNIQNLGNKEIYNDPIIEEYAESPKGNFENFNINLGGIRNGK